MDLIHGWRSTVWQESFPGLISNAHEIVAVKSEEGKYYNDETRAETKGLFI